MKKTKLTLRKMTIQPLTPRELRRAAGGLFEQERQDLTLLGVSGPKPPDSATCSWGCSNTCSNYETCA